MPNKTVSQVMDFYPKIYFACHTRHVHDIDKDVKLTTNQVSVLDHLSPDDPITLFDLAMHMGVTPSTMTITVNRLKELGYILKEKDRVDKRKVNLTLSAAGVKIKKSKSVLDASRVKNMLSRLNATEQKIALEGLGLLAYASEMEMKSKSLEKSWRDRYNDEKS